MWNKYKLLKNITLLRSHNKNLKYKGNDNEFIFNTIEGRNR